MYEIDAKGEGGERVVSRVDLSFLQDLAFKGLGQIKIVNGPR